MISGTTVKKKKKKKELIYEQDPITSTGSFKQV